MTLVTPIAPAPSAKKPGAPHKPLPLPRPIRPVRRSAAVPKASYVFGSAPWRLQRQGLSPKQVDARIAAQRAASKRK